MPQTHLPEMSHCRHANRTAAKLVKEFGNGSSDQDHHSQQARLPIDGDERSGANVSEASADDQLHGNNTQVHTPNDHCAPCCNIVSLPGAQTKHLPSNRALLLQWAGFTSQRYWPHALFVALLSAVQCP